MSNMNMLFLLSLTEDISLNIISKPSNIFLICEARGDFVYMLYIEIVIYPLRLDVEPPPV